jgi:hypothetical protein
MVGWWRDVRLVHGEVWRKRKNGAAEWSWIQALAFATVSSIPLFKVETPGVCSARVRSSTQRLLARNRPEPRWNISGTRNPFSVNAAVMYLARRRTSGSGVTAAGRRP